MLYIVKLDHLYLLMDNKDMVYGCNKSYDKMVSLRNRYEDDNDNKYRIVRYTYVK